MYSGDRNKGTYYILTLTKTAVSRAILGSEIAISASRFYDIITD